MRLLALLILICSHLSVNGQRYGTGLVFNDVKYAKAKIRATFNDQDFELLPESYSLKLYCPPPGNQLQLNTSPSWATAWSAKSILDQQMIPLENQVNVRHPTYSPPFLYQHVRQSDDVTCQAGIELYDALEFIKGHRLQKFDDFMEFCPRDVPQELQPENDGNSVDYRKLFDNSHSKTYKVNAVKKSLSQNLPVVVGMHCPPSFFTARKFWQPSEILSQEYPGHAICVVGYDDDAYGGSFEILNSWGKDWGNNGFLWIPYDEFVEFTRYAYEVFQLSPGENGNEISGSIQLKLSTDKIVEMEPIRKGVYKSSHPFDSTTYFRIYLKNESPAFVYVFGIDAQNKFDKVFPHQDSISPALVYHADQLALPGEDSYIKIVGDPGQENLYILFSKESIDLDNLIANLSRYPGSLLENLDALLDGNLIASENIDWEETGIGFNVISKDQSAIFIQIQINHI